MIVLKDLFIGEFPVSQVFGVNYETYKWIKDYAGRPIKGHNGVDFGYGGRNDVLLVAPFDCVVSKVGYDKNGYGYYLRMWDKKQQCVVLYAHCKEIKVREGEGLICGQLVAIGDNTGWSTGPHLHCGVYKVDDEGNKLNRDNGFDGWLNILDGRSFKWEVQNLKEPVKGGTMSDENMQISIKDFERIRGSSEKWDKVVAYLELSGDPALTPYEDVMNKIKGYKARETEIIGKLKDLEGKEINLTEQVSRLKDQLTAEQKLYKDLFSSKNSISTETQKQLGSLQGRIEDLQGQIDQMGKDKGTLNERIKELEAELGYITLFEYKPLKLALIKKN